MSSLCLFKVDPVSKALGYREAIYLFWPGCVALSGLVFLLASLPLLRRQRNWSLPIQRISQIIQKHSVNIAPILYIYTTWIWRKQNIAKESRILTTIYWMFIVEYEETLTKQSWRGTTAIREKRVYFLCFSVCILMIDWVKSEVG